MVWPYPTIWEEKVEYSELVSKYAAKSRFETFLKNIENPCLDPKYRSEIIRNWKNTSEIYLGDAGWKLDSEKMIFFLKDFLKDFGMKISMKNANKICIKQFSFFEIRLSYK